MAAAWSCKNCVAGILLGVAGVCLGFDSTSWALSANKDCRVGVNNTLQRSRSPGFAGNKGCFLETGQVAQFTGGGLEALIRLTDGLAGRGGRGVHGWAQYTVTRLTIWFIGGVQISHGSKEQVTWQDVGISVLEYSGTPGFMPKF